MMETLLSIRELSVDLPVRGRLRRILSGVSLDVLPGEIVGLVGESGSGKSVMASAVLQLLPGGSRAIHEGGIWFRGEEISRAAPGTMRRIRGNEIAMIFQEPMTSMNPVLTVKQQLLDVLRAHRNLSKEQAALQMESLLKSVGISEPARVLRSYPYQLSGGMRQRILIAMAQICTPALLIADEPTTALDVTIQAQILRLLQAAARDNGTAVLLISHDLGIVSQLCRRVAVMYAGEIVEEGTTGALLAAPRHPYTQALLRSVPDFSTAPGQLTPLGGTAPEAGTVMPGCHFQPRCPEAMTCCVTQAPVMRAGEEFRVKCHRWRTAKEEAFHDGAAATGEH